MIDSNINKLISMAERQSDQRLAQELNPQTETGLLGPAFISASELAYRQKIRDEAQARPMQSPPIVQQLAQQATMSPVQPMPTAPMPMQQQQMLPQAYAMGGLIKMANGGMPDPYKYNEKEIEDRARDKARTFGGNLFSNIAFGAGDADALKAYAEKGKTSDRLTKALERANLPSDATQEMVSAYRSGTPATVFQSAIDNVPTVYSPLEQRKQLDQGNPVFVGNIDYGGDQLFGNTIALDPKSQYEGYSLLPESEPYTQEKLEEIKTSGIASPPNAGQIDDGVDKSGGKGADGKVDGVNTLPTTGVSSSVTKDMIIGASADYQKLIDQSLERMTDEKGRMQNKWLRIAAGAFNAAQKGSPTLLGGLADLGAGVTEELIALNAEEQKQAQELFALFTAREKLRLDSLKGQYDQQKIDRTFQLDVASKAGEFYSKLKNVNIAGGNRLTEEDIMTEVALKYADMGDQSSRQFMAREAKKILAEQKRLKELYGDDSSTAIAEFDRFLNESPHYRKIYENRLDRLTPGVNDWLVDLLAAI